MRPRMDWIVALGLLWFIGTTDGRAQAPTPAHTWPNDPTAERIWPDVAPGSEGVDLEEVATDRSDRPPRNRAVKPVIVPTLTYYLPDPETATVALVLPLLSLPMLSPFREGVLRSMRNRRSERLRIVLHSLILISR